MQHCTQLNPPCRRIDGYQDVLSPVGGRRGEADDGVNTPDLEWTRSFLRWHKVWRWGEFGRFLLSCDVRCGQF